jgi:hypothetical protein
MWNGKEKGKNPETSKGENIIRKNYVQKDSRERERQRAFVIFFFQSQRNCDEIKFDRSSSCSNNFRKNWLIQRFWVANSFSVSGARTITASSEKTLAWVDVDWD